MKAFTYKIKDEYGIHARPVGLLVKETGKFSSDITVTGAGKCANAKRLFAVMGLGIKQTGTITVTAEALKLFCKGNV